MIEEVIRNFLMENVGAPVLLEVPKDPPESFFIVEKTGSVYVNHIKTSTIAIQSYAASKYEAAEANEGIKDLMIYELIYDPDIVSVNLNSDYDFTDVAEKKYRYQAVFDIVHY